MPLTPEAIGDVLGYSPAVVRRVIQELNLPAAYFAHCYSIPQIRVILNKLNDEHLDRLERTHHARTPSNERHRTANPTDSERGGREARRTAQIGEGDGEARKAGPEDDRR